MLLCILLYVFYTHTHSLTEGITQESVELLGLIWFYLVQSKDNVLKKKKKTVSLRWYKKTRQLVIYLFPTLYQSSCWEITSFSPHSKEEEETVTKQTKSACSKVCFSLWLYHAEEKMWNKWFNLNLQFNRRNSIPMLYSLQSQRVPF